jgi:hypothetical protein
MSFAIKENSEKDKPLKKIKKYNRKMHNHVRKCFSSRCKKGKVVPVLNYALRHEGVWGSGRIEPHFLDLGTSWR